MSDDRSAESEDVTRVLQRDSSVGSMTLGDAPPRPTLEIGSHLDRFELRGSLGRGGMGEVFRAHDPRLGREVALKLLRRSADPTAEARLLREAQAMAQINHPNILPIFDVRIFEARDEVRPEERGESRFALAEALGPTERGLALARAARADYAGSEAGNEDALEEIDRWLDQR